MRTRHRSDSGNLGNPQQIRKRGQEAKPEVVSLAGSSVGDRLEYIAAMVRELKILSLQASCPTLTGILDLAFQEALQRRRALP